MFDLPSLTDIFNAKVDELKNITKPDHTLQILPDLPHPEMQKQNLKFAIQSNRHLRRLAIQCCDLEFIGTIIQSLDGHKYIKEIYFYPELFKKPIEASQAIQSYADAKKIDPLQLPNYFLLFKEMLTIGLGQTPGTTPYSMLHQAPICSPLPSLPPSPLRPLGTIVEENRTQTPPIGDMSLADFGRILKTPPRAPTYADAMGSPLHGPWGTSPLRARDNVIKSYNHHSSTQSVTPLLSDLPFGEEAPASPSRPTVQNFGERRPMNIANDYWTIATEKWYLSGSSYSPLIFIFVKEDGYIAPSQSHLAGYRNVIGTELISYHNEMLELNLISRINQKIPIKIPVSQIQEMAEEV